MCGKGVAYAPAREGDCNLSGVPCDLNCALLVLQFGIPRRLLVSVTETLFSTIPMNGRLASCQSRLQRRPPAHSRILRRPRYTRVAASRDATVARSRSFDGGRGAGVTSAGV